MLQADTDTLYVDDIEPELLAVIVALYVFDTVPVLQADPDAVPEVLAVGDKEAEEHTEKDKVPELLTDKDSVSEGEELGEALSESPFVLLMRVRKTKIQ